MKYTALKILISCTIFASALSRASARSAILMAHYGSSDDETRALTIDRITADVSETFPDMLVVQAYISPVVRKNLTARGIDAPSPADMLQRLADTGIDTVYIQSTTIIEGAETADVRSIAEAAKDKFKHIAVGNPLCFSPADCMALVNILGAVDHDADEAVIWCGHGNNLPSTATYAMLDHMLQTHGYTNVHVSTIEGYPTAHSTISQLRRNPDIKRVKLVPLLLVCGNHTKKDIAGEFADQMHEAGYGTSVEMLGLGQRQPVRKLYVERVKSLIKQ